MKTFLNLKIYGNKRKFDPNKEKVNVSILDALNEPNSIHLKAHASTWQEALSIMCQMFKSCNVIDEFYYDDLCLEIENNFDDFVIAPGIVLPHIRKTAHVKGNKIVFLSLKNPIKWGDHDISYIIGFTDFGDQYITMLTYKQIAAVFSVPDILKKLNGFTNPSELLNFIQKILVLLPK